MMGIPLAGLFAVLFLVLFHVCLAKIFEKAGEGGWKAFVPLYNMYTYAKVAGYQGASIVLLLVPFLNIFYYIATNVKLAKRFNYPGIFGFFLALSPGLFLPFVAFGDNTYQPVEKKSNSVAEKQPLHEKNSTSNIFVDENGDHVERIRLEDW
ncbi:MAG: DUF5684 domain-containing protein [Bacteroidia bacterium]|nr:DUF5684 domain-containing protein [Bacteroidia bacterium]